MSVGVVIVTHGATGDSLIEMAEFLLGESMAEIRFVPFRQSGDNITTIDEVGSAMAAANTGATVAAAESGSSPVSTSPRHSRPLHRS